MKTLITAVMVFAICLLAHVPHSEAARFRCRSGDAACLIASMNTANNIGGANIITLDPGTYSLTSINNDTDGPNGLPSVIGTLTIRGAGDGAAIIARQSGAPDFRIFHIKSTGALTLENLIIKGGSVLALPPVSAVSFVGAGILNHGILTLAKSTLTGNNVRAAFQSRGMGAGLANAGSALLLNSAVLDNSTEARGGGIANNGGTVLLLNSTVAGNHSFGTGGVGLLNFEGTIMLLNSTVTANSGGGPGGAGGIANSSDGTVILGNTLLADNFNVNGPPDCSGRVTSLDNNLIGSITGCEILPQPSDIAGQDRALEPELGDLADADIPGRGHHPLLSDSPAINAGNNAICPRFDQIGQQRAGMCDIGAIELPRLFRGNPPPLPQ